MGNKIGKEKSNHIHLPSLSKLEKLITSIQGNQVKISCKDNSVFTGVLVGYMDGFIVVETLNNSIKSQRVLIDFDNVKTLQYDFLLEKKD